MSASDTGVTPSVPLACVVDAIAPAERPAHLALIARLFEQAVQERRDIPDGYSFRFDAEMFDDVSRFVANERRCCPFLSFGIEQSPDRGPLWLRLSGPRGTRTFLEAELSLR